MPKTRLPFPAGPLPPAVMHGTEPIYEGDAVTRVTLPDASVYKPVHVHCFERDWERLLSGLEPFPLRFAKPS